MSSSKVFHTSPSHALHQCLCSSPLQSFCWAHHYPPMHPSTMSVHKSTSTHLSFVELLILLVKGQACIASVFNSDANSKSSSVEICKQTILKGWSHMNIFSRKHPNISFTFYQCNHLVSIFQFYASNPVSHWIHCCHVCQSWVQGQ